jgi:hypothetical protein
MKNFIAKLGYKTCKICGIKKPLNEFIDDKKARDGKYSWCKSCKNKKQRERYSKLSEKNKSKLSKQQEKSRNKTLEKWEPVIKEMYNMNEGFKCQCCGKDLTFPKFGLGSVNYNQSIYFDHKSNNILIQGSPTRWLRCHKVSNKNIKTFQLCNFGVLCKTCNTRLGNPRERKQRVLQDYKYVFGGPLNQSSEKAVQLESSGGAR